MGNVISALFGKRKRVDAAKLQDHLQELRSYIARDLRGGFVARDELVPSAVEMLSDECDAQVLRPHAQRLLQEEIEALRAEQETWPAVTDCDRLDQAFARLEGAGIVCRQNFTCCGTCGSAEIWDEIEEARESGLDVRGYAFFHMQDTESAVEGHGLYLNYGAVTEGEAAALAVAGEIAAEMAAAGLEVKWDGSWDRRIGVGLDWKRRVPL